MTPADRKHPNLTITPFYVNASPQATYSPWSSPELTVQYDHRGRLQPYVETSEQRRARLEFLRKREFSRRISAWLEDSSKPEVRPSPSPGNAERAAHTLSSCSQTSESSSRTGSLKSSSSDTDSLHTIDEDDEVEGEVIYSTSPAASRWASSPTPASTAITNNNTNGRPRALRASSRSSSFSSLSSISEEDAPCV